jgi:hypothetical protein
VPKAPVARFPRMTLRTRRPRVESPVCISNVPKRCRRQHAPFTREENIAAARLRLATKWSEDIKPIVRVSLECSRAARKKLLRIAREPVIEPSESQEIRFSCFNPESSDLREVLNARLRLRNALEKERGPRPVPSNVPAVRDRHALKAYMKKYNDDFLEYARRAEIRENHRVFVGVNWALNRVQLQEEKRRERNIGASLLDIYNCASVDDFTALCDEHDISYHSRRLIYGWWTQQRCLIVRSFSRQSGISLVECPFCQRFFHS